MTQWLIEEACLAAYGKAQEEPAPEETDVPPADAEHMERLEMMARKALGSRGR